MDTNEYQKLAARITESELIDLIDQLGDALAAALRGAPVPNADELFVRAALVVTRQPKRED